jgi:hypothetical protein
MAQEKAMYYRGHTLNKEPEDRTITKIERAQEVLLVLGVIAAIGSWCWAIVY